MFKKLLNRKGSMALVGIIVIPLVISIVFFYAFSKMNESILYKNIQSQVDNICVYSTQTYGRTKIDKDGNAICDFNTYELFGSGDNSINLLNTSSIDLNLSTIDETNPLSSTDPYNDTDGTDFLRTVYRAFLLMDGINSNWQVTITIRTNLLDDGTYIDSTKSDTNEYIVFDVIAVLPETHAKSIDSYQNWYQGNSKTWEAIESESNYIYTEVEVWGSCV